MTGNEEDEINELTRNCKVFVAKRRKIIGFVALKTVKEGDMMEISGLATVEHERRKGIPLNKTTIAQ